MQIRSCTLDDLPEVIELYRACFAEPPWYEVFNPSELAVEFSGYLTLPGAVFLVASQDGKIVGATIGFAMRNKPEMLVRLDHAWLNAFYLAELFVDRGYRRRGIAKLLVTERFLKARDYGYLEAVVRTSTDQRIIRRLYAGLGFIELDRQDVVSTKIVDGVESEQPDQRVILGGRIRRSNI